MALLHGLQEDEAIRFFAPPDAGSIYLRLPLLAASETLAERFVTRLAAAGIGAGRMYRKTMAEFFPQLAGQAYPGAEAAARRLVTLPTHHAVQEHDLLRIRDVMQQVVCETQVYGKHRS
jgi:dTDP-4-amino-4,6-dideoxygalactose transaminase